MSIIAKIPLDKENYSVYVNCKIINKIFLEEYGTLIEFEGTGVIFYYYSNHRRAYVITEIKNKIPLLYGNLPLVREKVTIIYEARGRRIDLLKFALYNLEKEYGSKFYELPVPFWLCFTAYIDSCKPKNNAKKNLRIIKSITEKYLNNVVKK